MRGSLVLLAAVVPVAPNPVTPENLRDYESDVFDVYQTRPTFAEEAAVQTWMASWITKRLSAIESAGT
jgi:hypothetical protein